MIGINYTKIESNSVGYKTDYEMHSMDFEEFLWAKGYDDNFITSILTHMQEIKPFNELELSVLNSLFMDFCILGGMPAVVREYCTRGRPLNVHPYDKGINIKEKIYCNLK